jgi:hypothetical protein
MREYVVHLPSKTLTLGQSRRLCLCGSGLLPLDEEAFSQLVGFAEPHGEEQHAIEGTDHDRVEQGSGH